MDFIITHVDSYHFKQKTSYFVDYPSISLIISGFRNLKQALPDGTLTVENRDVPCHFNMSAKGHQISFEADENRQNWVIQLDTKDLRFSEQTGFVEIHHNGTWITLPIQTPVLPELIPGWQKEMHNIKSALFSPVPTELLRAKLSVLNIIKFIIEEYRPQSSATPAAQFKKLIDEDETFSHDLSDFSKICGYSKDHLRIMFKKQYQISPQTYRHQRRMARVVELISGSSLSVKEIAHSTGFKHSSHLCLVYKKAFCISVGDAIKRLRHRSFI